jgi:hypothetical protein
MEVWLPTIIWVLGGIALFVLALVVVGVLKARHPHERDEGFLWAEAQRIAGGILVAVLVGGLILITLRYS